MDSGTERAGESSDQGTYQVVLISNAGIAATTASDMQGIEQAGEVSLGRSDRDM